MRSPIFSHILHTSLTPSSPRLGPLYRRTCRGDHERRYGCHMYPLTTLDGSIRAQRPHWEAEVPWPQPLSAQKGCGVARFVRVPGMRLMMIGGTLQSSHSVPTHIPAAHATSAVAWIFLQPDRLHHCTVLIPFDAQTRLLASRC